MSRLPWEPDRFLDREMAGRVVGCQFPEFATLPVSYLASGWDNDCYQFGSEWILRFPRRAEVQERLDLEIELSRLLQTGLELPSPNFEKVGQADEEFPYRFVGYRKLAGEPWTRSSRVNLDFVAGQLGSALTQIHGLQNPPCVQVSTWGLRDDLQEFREIQSTIEEVLPADLKPWWSDVLDADPELPPEYQGPNRFIHNDLGREHVLIDPATGKASGIIDFADAELGDPSRDLISFQYHYGRGFVAKIMDQYSWDLDDGFYDRLDSTVKIRSAIWLGHSAMSGDRSDLATHLAAIREYVTRNDGGDR
jgi:aminoglycoside phosphotransferase (APT) family kinase protein